MYKRISRASVILATVLAGSALCTGCSVDSSASTEDAMTEQGPQTLVIDESGNGGSFQVVEGQDVVLRLTSNPSTGYNWLVASTDRTFGYPSESFTPNEPGQAGSGGLQQFVWKTDGPFSMVGAHTVVLEYKRSWEDAEAAETFTFTVEVVSADGPDDGTVIVDESAEDSTVDVVEGQDVLLLLGGNPTTGYEWAVGSVDKSFGYPVSEDFVPEGEGEGSGGVYEFVWKTDGPMMVAGSHIVVMEYKRSWEQEAAETFTFTVNVVRAEQ